MAETKTPDIQIAFKESSDAKGYTIRKSLVEKTDFSEEELGRINARLKTLHEKTDGTILKHQGALVVKREQLSGMINKLQSEKRDAEQGERPELTQQEVESVITEDKFEQAESGKKKWPAETLKENLTESEISNIKTVFDTMMKKVLDQFPWVRDHADKHIETILERLSQKKKENNGTLSQEQITIILTEEATKLGAELMGIPQPEWTSPNSGIPEMLRKPLETGVAQGDQKEAVAILEKSGLDPNGTFLKKILEFFHNFFNGKEISYDQSTVFDRVVGPYLEKKGFSLYTKTAGQDGKEISSTNKDAKISTMRKLASLGVPLEESGKFLGYIMGDTPETSISPQLLPLFNAGKNHFNTVRNTLGGMSSKVAIDTMLAFTPPPSPTAPWISADQPTDTNASKENEVMIGTEKITGTPDEIKAFNSLNDTAHKIIGKDFKTETLLTADNIKDAKPEAKIALLGKELFIRIVDTLKAAYGNDFATKLDEKKVDAGTRGLFTNFMDGTTKLDAKTLPTMNDIMNKTLEHVFWHGVWELEKNIVAWRDDKAVKDGSDDKFNDEIANKLLSSVKWHEGRAGEKWAWDIQKATGEIGFAGLIAQNIAQKKHFDTLKKTLISASTVAAFNSSKPELKTEIA